MCAWACCASSSRSCRDMVRTHPILLLSRLPFFPISRTCPWGTFHRLSEDISALGYCDGQGFQHYVLVSATQTSSLLLDCEPE